jgi:hypothetical protein
MSERDALAWRIGVFIDGALGGPRPAHPETFDELALAVHAWQASSDPVLQSLVLGPVRDVTDIPAVPIDLFKELPVGTVGPDEDAVVFRTSGTTQGKRGVHRLRDTVLYDQGAVGWFRAQVPGIPDRVVALLEDPATAPDSSLSHMVSRFAPVVRWLVREGVVDHGGLAAETATGPAMFLAATAFAAAEALERGLVGLPEGSTVMVTGGFKGRTVAFDERALLARLAALPGVVRVVTEYGMCELSSQLWGAPGQPYRPPPWLRVAAVDPMTGAVLPSGTAGLLRFWDLCNLDSTLGIETLDEGIVEDDGAVRLFGRIASASPRGCSLTIEEAWDKRR